MAVRPRRRRRRSFLVLAVLASLVVLGLNAAISARSREPSRRLEELAYLDRLRPLVQRTNEQSADLADVRASATELGRAGISRRLVRLARESRTVELAAGRIDPPDHLRTAHTLLHAALVIRAEATDAISEALVRALGTEPPEPAVSALRAAGEDLAAADRNYRIFLAALPEVDDAAELPGSAWVRDPALWSGPELAAFVTGLRSAETLAPVHDVSVVLVNTDPAPVGSENGAAVLPPLRSLSVDVVVANVGNEAETRVTVLATISAPDGTVDTAREFVDLAPGQRHTVSLGLRPPVAASSLSVRIGPVDGEIAQSDNEQVIPLLIR